MSRMVAATQRAAASAQRVFEILDRVPSVPEPAQPGPSRAGCRARSRFATSASSMATGRVLQDVNLTIAPGRDDRPGRPQRRRQEHAGQPGLPVLRRQRRGDPGRRRRHPLVPRRGIPPQYRHRAARAVPVLRHDCREHRLRPARRHAGGNRRRGPGRAGPRIHPAACPTATIRWWASAASRSPAASGSGFRSRGPC